MVVVVPVVRGVPVPVVDVVQVIPVRDGHVPAAFTVDVVVSFVGHMLGGFTLVDVSVVDSVQMPVVHIVDVVAVWHGHVPAALAVGVFVACMFSVGGHRRAPRTDETVSRFPVSHRHPWFGTEPPVILLFVVEAVTGRRVHH
ncbi:hypothetical protein EBESD8_58970 [Rhodococcus aetherivorans]|nr:hypothetical protein EBESD8_58970 [Rhodococcus aetherivorans]